MPLNAKGLEQSEKLAAYMQHLPVDKIYCSSMLRACMTAAPLAMSKNMSYQPLEFAAGGKLRCLGGPGICGNQPPLA